MRENILIREKQASILVALRDASKEWSVSSLAKASGTTYVHACNFLKECERLGLTTGERHGKMKVVRLTSKGARISEMMASIYSMVSGAETPEPPQEPPVQQAAPEAPQVKA